MDFVKFDERRTEELREASGRVTAKDPLVDFFYHLIRDELPAGKVERIMRNSINPNGEESIFTNGWLAQYAKNLADQLRNAKSNNLLEDVIENKEIDDEGLKELEEQLIQECGGLEQSNISTFEDAKNAVEQLRASGGLSKEDAERVEKELESINVEEEPK